MTISFVSIIGSVFLTIGGILLGKFYTERGAIPVFRAFRTVLEGIRDTQTSMPPPPPEALPPEPDIDPETLPTSQPPNGDYEPIMYTPSLDTTLGNLQTEITNTEARNTRDLYLGILFIIIGIILLFSPSLLSNL